MNPFGTKKPKQETRQLTQEEIEAKLAELKAQKLMQSEAEVFAKNFATAVQSNMCKVHDKETKYCITCMEEYAKLHGAKEIRRCSICEEEIDKCNHCNGKLPGDYYHVASPAENLNTPADVITHICTKHLG
jgi:hypothetical protein